MDSKNTAKPPAVLAHIPFISIPFENGVSFPLIRRKANLVEKENAG